MHMKNTRTYTIKIRITALFVSIILFLGMVGCSHSGQTPSESVQPSETPQPTKQSQPVHGGTLRLPMPENVLVENNKLNPLLVRTEETYQLYSMLFDPLIAVDDTNMLAPSLARSWKEDDSGWLISLRNDVKWHNGSAFTADDVINTFEALKALGKDCYYSDTNVNVLEILKVDELSIHVKTKYPGLMSLYSLNFPIVKFDADGSIFGTGAYKLESASSERVILEVNNEWWDKTPYFDTVEFLARGSNDLALASYEAGLLDFVPSSQLTVGQYASAGETIVADCMTQQMETLLINHNNEFLKDSRFRSAIAMLIDRATIINNTYMGKAQSCDVPFPPDSWLYDASCVAFDYDVEGAKQLLSDIGFNTDADERLCWNYQPIKLRLLCSSTPENTIRADAAKLIAANLNAVGIEAEIIEVNNKQTEEDNPFITKLEEGEWDLAAVGFNLAQSNELSEYLYSDGHNNYGHYRDVEMENLVGALRNMSSEQPMRDTAYELQAHFIEELPFIVLYFRLDSVIYNAKIQGIGTLREPWLVCGQQNWHF